MKNGIADTIRSIPYPPASRGLIILWSLMATFPFGGMTWHRLHWLVGLRRLGFDIWYVEDSDRPVHDPVTFWPSLEYTGNVAYLSKQMERVGLGDRWVFRPPDVLDQCLGATDLNGLKRLYRQADAVINLSGAQEWRPDHADIRCLVYLNTDPVAIQVDVAEQDQQVIQMLDAYHHFFTYGENLGRPDCLVPIERYRWQPTRAPVCIDWWTNSGAPSANAALSTVASWKHTDKDIVWRGENYAWRKDLEFRRFIKLPYRSALSLELALSAINDHDKAELHRNGWRVIPSVSLAEPDVYRDYICGSLGEFTVAKDQNVRLRSGWFSDRSACYLAAGRPVITQDTGFGNIIPTGEGLFSFSTEEEALAAIDAVARDYARHSAAAREIAREFFDAERVLGHLLRCIGLL